MEIIAIPLEKLTTRHEKGREAPPTSSASSSSPFVSLYRILHPYEVQRIPLDDERIAFGVLEALDFEVYVEVGPLDGFGA